MKKYIVVYCASSPRLEEKYYELGRALGRELARAGYGLVNGGGATGLMGATIDGCLEAGGEVIGVIPGFMDKKGWAHPGLTRKIVTADMHSRKKTMAELSSGAIALPGGIGTLDELAEIMTWRQLDIYRHPVVILNFEGFYNPLIDMMTKMGMLHFLRNNMDLYYQAFTAGEAVGLMNKAR